LLKRKKYAKKKRVRVFQIKRIQLVSRTERREIENYFDTLSRKQVSDLREQISVDKGKRLSIDICSWKRTEKKCSLKTES
jgi:hypothetical protein